MKLLMVLAVTTISKLFPTPRLPALEWHQFVMRTHVICNGRSASFHIKDDVTYLSS
jgi:hypothetical protein